MSTDYLNGYINGWFAGIHAMDATRPPTICLFAQIEVPLPAVLRLWSVETIAGEILMHSRVQPLAGILEEIA